MGSITPNENTTESQKIELNNILEKEKISIGTFKERYKVTKNDPKNFYDLIININTFSQKPDIKWKIETKTELKKSQIKEIKKEDEKEDKKEDKKEEKKEDKKDNKKEDDNQKKNEIINEEPKQKKEEIEHDLKENEVDKTVIGILGLGNVGKSYLLSFFTGEELPTGDSIHTKGISIKNIDHFTILDSEGIEAPLIKSNISEELYPKEGLLNKSVNESDHMIQKIARDKKAVELFIQDFIIEKSDILVIVVGQLTLTEQKLINRIVTETNKKNIFVIHNLKNFYSKEQILDYIEDTFKKNIFFKLGKNFSEQIYKGKDALKGKEKEFDKYFIETYHNADNIEKQVLHFIMGNNVEESKAYYFNKTVSDYIKEEMSSFTEGKKFNIFKELKDFLIKKGRKYVESNETYKNPFTAEDIKIDNDCITIKNENNRIKRCLINQLGFSQFYGALYSPNFTCYVDKNEEKKEKKLIVEINAPGKGFEFDKPTREEILDDGHKIIICFTGTKKLKDYPDFEPCSSNMDSGNFRIDIVLDYNQFRFKDNAPVEKKKLKGVVRFIYPLIYDDEANAPSEMKAVNIEFSKNEKNKEKKNKK